MSNALDYLRIALSDLFLAFYSMDIFGGIKLIDLIYTLLITCFIVYVFKRFAR